MGLAERGRLGEWRRSVVWRARGFVLEIAAGTGLDFPHYKHDTSVVATDPDVAMLRRAQHRASKVAAPILLVAADAEALPFRNGAFDAAVSALAMCTIPHPERALGELERVVRPAGTVTMLEHVRVAHPVLSRLQRWLTPTWRRVAGGCHLDRDTLTAVTATGLLVEDVKQHAGGLVVEISARVPQPARQERPAEDLAKLRTDVRCQGLPDTAACPA